jgi:hypothetical protein
MTTRRFDPAWVYDHSNRLVPVATWFSLGSVCRRNLWPPSLYGHKFVKRLGRIFVRYCTTLSIGHLTYFIVYLRKKTIRTEFAS